MKILYLDCYSGISGDMFLGALIDAGLSISTLRRELSKLELKDYKIITKKVKRGSIQSTKFEITSKKNSLNKRNCLKDILSLIRRSKLDRYVKEKSIQIFRSLAYAEAIVHGNSLEDMHLHEIGDLDSIIDIVGGVIGIRVLGVEKVYSSEINIGGSTLVETRSGNLPVPAPATIILLKDKPIVYSQIKYELVTPTGAALLSNLVEGFGYFPPMLLKSVGYGAGSVNFDDRPNCLRVMLGELKQQFLEDSIFVIEANIDDMRPTDYEHLIERVFEEGALDAYIIPIQMKKNRPGILFTVLSPIENLDRLCSVLFSESTTIGLRYYQLNRKKLERKITTQDTIYGKIKVKFSIGPDGTRKLMPEYADCKKAARLHKIPIEKVREEVLRNI